MPAILVVQVFFFNFKSYSKRVLDDLESQKYRIQYTMVLVFVLCPCSYCITFIKIEIPRFFRSCGKIFVSEILDSFQSFDLQCLLGTFFCALCYVCWS